MTGTFDVENVLSQLTLEEKASLTSGHDFWHLTGIERLGVPSVMVTDGPHGLRKQASDTDALGLGNSVPATCFPTAAALGSTWDPGLVRRVGEALGRETRANDVAVLLGPGVNIKRSPLCGRNFEYVSEDPHVSGVLGAALVEGVQSQGVGTSLKHYAANNQETDRHRVSADVDERTLREIYLPAFEHVVRTSQPWTVMCSYNRVNGVHASQHPWLLTQVLRDEWGFEGLVVSDWGAVVDRVAALRAGLDLEMPATGGRTDAEIVAAVRSGEVEESVLDDAARRVLQLVARSGPALAQPGAVDADSHHTLAREAAAGGSVLLRNEERDGVPALPLSPERLAGAVVLGEFARTPRYQGAGSSQVNPTRLDDALTALRAAAGRDLPFGAGFTVAGSGDPVDDAIRADDDERLAAEALALARGADTVLLFLGLPAPDESEGYDREHLDLPANQVSLLEALTTTDARIVVVLSNGSAVTLPWREHVDAILETWLGGQAGGSAVADLLTGTVAPSGRLAETIPHRLVDTPAYGNFPGELGHVRYGEGVLVGYRWYDARELAVAYPFGHGLTYTTFSYGTTTANVTGEGSGAVVDVVTSVTNTGGVAGAEVVQVYVQDVEASVLRPPRELKAFRKVHLAPGERAEVAFTLGARDLSYWHPRLRRWVVEGGRFVIEVGSSSREVRGQAVVDVVGESLVGELDGESTIAEWLAHPVGGPLLAATLASGGDRQRLDPEMAKMMASIPLRQLAAFGLTPVDFPTLERLLTQVRG